MNVPPTTSQLERLEKFADILKQLFDHAPIPFTYALDEEDENVYVQHTWMTTHRTIPARGMAILFGVPKHEPDCACLVPPPILMSVKVYDLDTEDYLPESGAIEVMDPQGSEIIASICVMAITAFNITANL